MHPLDTAVAPAADQRQELIRYLNLKLAALGQPVSGSSAEPYFLELARPLLRNYLVKDQMAGVHLSPAAHRIQTSPTEPPHEPCPAALPTPPANPFGLDRVGLAREMSLPPTLDHFSSPYLESYRVA